MGVDMTDKRRKTKDMNSNIVNGVAGLSMTAIGTSESKGWR